MPRLFISLALCLGASLAQADDGDTLRASAVRLTGLSAPVELSRDRSCIVHVQARNEADLWFMQGFVHARDRLFQMELQARAVAGTLAELTGTRTKELDREARAMGLAWGADQTFAALDPQSPAARAIQAYADGVNAYIAQMSPVDLPLEYRLLGATPQPWKPVYTAYLNARMGLTLAYSDGELRRAQVEAVIGKPAATALFPANAPLQEPIQPNGQHAARGFVTQDGREHALRVAAGQGVGVRVAHAGCHQPHQHLARARRGDLDLVDFERLAGGYNEMARELEAAVADSAHLIMTGQAQNAGYSAADFKNQECARIYGLFDCTNGISIDVQSSLALFDRVFEYLDEPIDID